MNSPSVFPAVVSRWCQVWVSRPVVPVGVDSFRLAIAHPVEPVEPQLEHRIV